jgi:hypothetical protein
MVKLIVEVGFSAFMFSLFTLADVRTELLCEA